MINSLLAFTFLIVNRVELASSLLVHIYCIFMMYNNFFLSKKKIKIVKVAFTQV